MDVASLVLALTVVAQTPPGQPGPRLKETSPPANIDDAFSQPIGSGGNSKTPPLPLPKDAQQPSRPSQTSSDFNPPSRRNASPPADDTPRPLTNPPFPSQDDLNRPPPPRSTFSSSTTRGGDSREPISGTLAPVRHQEPKKLAKTVLADVLAPVARTAGAATPITLHELLARSAGRVSRLEAIKAYWALTAAAADYAIDQEALQRARQAADAPTPGQAGRSAALVATLASLEAQAAEAQVVLTEMQWRVAKHLGDPRAVVLCAEAPHAGGYRSEFERIFATRTAPPHLYLVHRALPQRQKCVELRAESANAAQTALDAALDAHAQGRMGPDELLGYIDGLRAQRHAFVREVRAYNDVIADYAIGISGEAMELRSFVPLLIQSPVLLPTSTTPQPKLGGEPAKPLPGDAVPSTTPGGEGATADHSILRSPVRRVDAMLDRSIQPVAAQGPSSEARPAVVAPAPLRKIKASEVPPLQSAPQKSGAAQAKPKSTS
jgi:hypothetical protein